MHRSSSLAGITLKFDPREAQVGHSSIDKLPLRKVQSSKSLSRASSKPPQNQATLQSQQYHIDLMKRINESLERENAYLKKQLEFYANACSSRRSSITGMAASNSKKLEQRDKILARLQSRPDKNETESTGMFNSKLSSARKSPSEQTIKDIYEKYTLKSVLPKPELLSDLLRNYQQEIRDSYMKVKVLVDKMKTQQQNKANPLAFQQIDQITKLLEWTVLNKSNSKPTRPAQQKPPNKDQLLEQFFNEFSSQTELLAVFQVMMGKICKSPKTMEKLKGTVGFARLIRKINRLE